MRHVEELFFKFADQHVGSLDQGSDFVEQGIVLDRSHTATHFGRSRLQLTLDVCSPIGKAGDHGTIVLEHLGVVIGLLHDQR